MDDLVKKILMVTEDYARTISVEKTAKNMNLPTGTVRKMLITAGVWGNKLSDQIGELRKKHPDWDSHKISDTLKISVNTVYLYTPYKGLENFKDDTDRTSDEEVGSVIDRGVCGEKVHWKLTDNGQLTIFGSGPMDDFISDAWGVQPKKKPKWQGRRDNIYVKDIVISEGITAVGEYCFASLMKLRSVSFPSTLKEIRGGAFCGENHLTKILIPDGVSVISWDAFYRCILLEEIHIPASVKKIQTYAFHACVLLERMYFYGDAPKTAKSSFDMCRDNIVIYHRESAKGWGETWNGFRTEVF